jgi:predicted TIM-barrel fold metal-dependent hydrolase
VRAVTMFPLEHEYTISPWNAGALFKFLEHGRIPLLLGLDQVSWDGLHDILTRYPGLIVIMTGLHYAIDRNMYPLLREFPQLYLETSGIMAHRGIEDICARFGAQRLVFGSGMPVFSGGSAVSLVLYAAISAAEKAMIANGNLQRLLGGTNA